ncbi:glycoside hydrolase family 15 protein [Propioniciclava coleopterorum]|uniref:glycoside hydrolase family 15 protein n=1 Tax=Propioniciclava coleopterorum TaxID=2714937 RepID=UPI001FE4BA00|nr:glycoside hydrolase family 15 protein [Propioniciclava coleopterorum]
MRHGEVDALLAVAGPHAVEVHGPTLWAGQECEEANAEAGAATGRLTGQHELSAGETACWVMTWARSFVPMPQPGDPEELLAETLAFWNAWAERVAPDPGERREHAAEVMRSLLVLRALTDSRTGGIVAAPTTSLPEEFGGSRNWDYRYTWLRDAAFTIEAMIAHGYPEGAEVWRDWLLRAIAGEPNQLQIMYGLGGEKHLPERELAGLSGYADSLPVRIGNAAAEQYQADVAGEVMLALAQLREARGYDAEYSWRMQRNLIEYCIENIERPDNGIWEMRGEPQHFTHGRVMMWAAFDQGIKAVERYGLPGPVEEWRACRARLHDEIWAHGFDRELNTFTQAYGGTEVDASLLQLPQTGFVGYDDPAMLGTVAAIERDLSGPGGLLRRYRTETDVDGLPGDEYAFLICSFWLVEQHAMTGRRADAEALMARLVACANDVGLLAEEYDVTGGRLAGNYPQAFSHLGLIRAADALDGLLQPVPGSRPLRLPAAPDAGDA